MWDDPAIRHLRERSRERPIPDWMDIAGDVSFDDEPDALGVITTWARHVDSDGNPVLRDVARTFVLDAECAHAGAPWRAWWAAMPEVVESSRRLWTARGKIIRRLAEATNYPEMLIRIRCGTISYRIDGIEVSSWLADLDAVAEAAEEAKRNAWRDRRSLFGRLVDDGMSHTDISMLTGISRGSVAQLAMRADADVVGDAP